MHIENKKNVSPVSGDKKSKKSKNTNAGSKPQTMMTAFIRVTKTNYTGEDKKVVVTFTEDQIKDILEEWVFTASIEYWFIEHKPDDEDANDHFHIVIKFKSAAHFETVKNKFPFGNIQTAKNVRNAVQYLIHKNNPEKQQYTWEQIITNCKDMTPYKVLSKSQMEITLQRIFEKIEAGEITQFNYTEMIPIDVFSKHKSAIKNAIEYTVDKIISDPNRPIKVLYFYGKSGSGKSYHARDFCKAKYDQEPCFTSSSNDPLQDYKGEKALIWDDFRDYQFKFVDLLKFLDPNYRSSGKSRYVNKHFLGELIILTSTQRLDSLYSGCLENPEDMLQLRRRISEIHEYVEDKIRIYIYIGNNRYKFFREYLNPYYGMESKPVIEDNFDFKTYEKLAIKLVNPNPELSDFTVKEGLRKDSGVVVV